jgi:hypothetical protein
VTITITGIGQDEAVDAKGSGSTCPDALGVGAGVAQIRVERAGPGDGRVYAIDFLAEDGRGGACEGFVTVCVPHDQGHGGACGDQGALADSTGFTCLDDCEGDECIPDACDGDLPRGVTRRLGRAGHLLDIAARRGKARPVRKALTLLGKTERKVARLAAHDELSDECTEAVADRVHVAARRAEGWLGNRGR